MTGVNRCCKPTLEEKYEKIFNKTCCEERENCCDFEARKKEKEEEDGKDKKGKKKQKPSNKERDQAFNYFAKCCRGGENTCCEYEDDAESGANSLSFSAYIHLVGLLPFMLVGFHYG